MLLHWLVGTAQFCIFLGAFLWVIGKLDRPAR